MLNRFLRNIELWLSGAGLLVVWIASAVVQGGTNLWQVAALTALAVSVLHGFIFWIIRRRQRQVRAEAILEIREMLADVVKNQLAVIGMSLPPEQDRTLYEEQVEDIKGSVTRIEYMVDAISEETIRDWKATYSEAIASTGALHTA